VTNSSTGSEWFGHFVKGNKRRMRQISKLDLAILLEMVVLYVAKVESRALLSWTEDKRGLWVWVGADSLLCNVGSLGGNEGFLLDLYCLCLYLAKGQEPCLKPHVIASFLGRFKNESGEPYHLILFDPGNCQWVVASGLA
jgi:hypothetical protein